MRTLKENHDRLDEWINEYDEYDEPDYRDVLINYISEIEDMAGELTTLAYRTRRVLEA